MDPCRKNEPERHHFRSDRLIVINGAWYIATREGIDVGPFVNRQRADAASIELRNVLAGIKDAKIARRFIREFESHLLQTGRTPIIVADGSKKPAQRGLAYRLEGATQPAVPIPLRVRRWLGD